MGSFRAFESHYCQFFRGLHEQSFSWSEPQEESEHRLPFSIFALEEKKHLTALLTGTFVVTLDTGAPCTSVAFHREIIRQLVNQDVDTFPYHLATVGNTKWLES